MSSLPRLILACTIIFALLLLAWVVLRLGKVRGTLARSHDQHHADDALRAQAQALLAERLARGEIDQATHRQLVQRLWGVEPSPAPPETHPRGH